VSLAEGQTALLDQVAQQMKVSRSHVVRDALDSWTFKARHDASGKAKKSQSKSTRSK
jgi:metal-responsive CopG/Arc/MetJ family transcriptional regulator